MSLTRYQYVRRLVLGAIIVVAFVALLFVGSSGSQERHDLVEAVGLGFIVVGIVGRMWCTLYIGSRKSSEIVDTGPYSVTRNPLYVFSSIAAAGVGAQTGSVVLSLLFMLGCVGAFLVVIRREERYLAEHFGATYRSYLERVPRFVPRPSLYRDEGTLTISTSRLYTTFGDGLVFFIAKPAFEFVEYLQATGAIPVLLHLY